MNALPSTSVELDILECLEVPIVLVNDDLGEACSTRPFALRFGAPEDETFPLRTYLRNPDAVLRAIELAKTVSGAIPVRLIPLGKNEGFIGSVCKISGVGRMNFLIQSRQQSSTRFLELNRELTTVTEALSREQSLKKKYENSSRAVERFITMLVHDIRSPLSNILLSLSLIKDQLPSGDLSMLTETAQGAKDSANRLMDFINSLYRSTQVETLTLERTPVALASIIHDLRSDLSHALSTENGTLHYDPALLPVVNGDAQLLRQLMQNLLQNSIKFRQPGRPLEIEVSYQETDQCFPEILVRDNGVGFDPSEAELLFELYHRSDDRMQDGIGVGLATCKLIAEKHGWQIRAEGTPGEGACFRIRIPLTHISAR